MTTLAEQIAALEDALAKRAGAIEIADRNGRRVRYAGPAEMLDALGRLKAADRTARRRRPFGVIPLRGAS